MNGTAVADPWAPQPHRVITVQREAADTVTLGLGAVGEPHAGFEPGQFNMLYAFGIGEIAVSLSGDPLDDARLVHTVRAVGAVSRAISSLTPGELLGVRGPFGSSWPLQQARQRDLLLVAGGLGLAPLRPAVLQILQRRAHYRRVILLVGMRSSTEILFREQLEQWRARPDVELEITVDRPDPAWRGHVGVVPSLIARLELEAAAAVALVGGPEIMMRFTVNALRDLGVPAAQIHLSMERNMQCAVGLCGHCQFGPSFICRDGPVLSLQRIGAILSHREV
jgi:NAD(P)H-flavin reductase